MLTLSDLAIQPIEADEAAAITVGLAAILPDDLPEPRRPALNQIRLTDTGAIELDGCNEPIAPGQEAQWLAEVLLALLGLDEARRYAGTLREQALAALAAYGARARRLVELADWITLRTH